MVAVSLAVALGWRSMATMSRLLFTVAEQTRRPSETLLGVNGNNLNGVDCLLFDSSSCELSRTNGFWPEQRPTEEQQALWHRFLRLVGARTQAESLASIPDVRYYWFGSDAHKQGPAEARWHLFGFAKNEWVTGFDDDDVLHRRRIEFLSNAIEFEPIDAIYTGMHRFQLRTETLPQLLAWWYDPLVASDVQNLTDAQASLPARIEEYFTADLQPLSEALREEIEATMQEVPTRTVPHRNWKVHLTHPNFPELKKTCQGVLEGREPRPRFEDADPNLLYGNTSVHHDRRRWNQYLDRTWYNYRDEFRLHGPDSHVQPKSDDGLVSLGWLTMSKFVFNHVRQTNSYDDGTYQFWRMMHLCRKASVYYNVLGLYLKPRYHEY